MNTFQLFKCIEQNLKTYFKLSKSQSNLENNSFYSLGNFKLFFQEQNVLIHFLRQPTEFLDQLIASTKLVASPRAGLTKQTYKQLHVSSRNVLKFTSEFTSVSLITSVVVFL